jgi:hypothetical protein
MRLLDWDLGFVSKTMYISDEQTDKETGFMYNRSVRAEPMHLRRCRLTMQGLHHAGRMAPPALHVGRSL